MGYLYSFVITEIFTFFRANNSSDYIFNFLLLVISLSINSDDIGSILGSLVDFNKESVICGLLSVFFCLSVDLCKIQQRLLKLYLVYIGMACVFRSIDFWDFFSQLGCQEAASSTSRCNA